MSNIYDGAFSQAWKVSLLRVILVRIFPHSVGMRENADQENSE